MKAYGEYKIDFTKYIDADTFKKSIQDKYIFNFDYDQVADDQYNQLATEAELVCLYFKRPPYFADIVKQAIFCGKAEETYFKHTSTEVIEGRMSEYSTTELHIPHVVINVSPTSTYDDVKQALRDAQKLYKTDTRLSYYKPRIGKKNRIVAYRYWYWMKKQGMTISEISDRWTDMLENNATEADYDETIISKGIKEYINLLRL